MIPVQVTCGDRATGAMNHAAGTTVAGDGLAAVAARQGWE
jgi:hypothetical protein